jgi:hypothetical protein
VLIVAHESLRDAYCLPERRTHGENMKAQFYQFNLGGRQLGWPAKVLLGVLAVAGLAVLLSVGLMAAVFAVAAFAITRLVIGLRRSLGLAPAAQETSRERRVAMPAEVDVAGESVVREIEVEVLPAKREK